MPSGAKAAVLGVTPNRVAARDVPVAMSTLKIVLLWLHQRRQRPACILPAKAVSENSYSLANSLIAVPSFRSSRSLAP